jgi:hypothetical protein
MWAGFSFEVAATVRRSGTRASHANAAVRPSDFAGTEIAPPAFVVSQRCAMPIWMEILINVIGYAGFIGIATYHKSPSKNSPEQ